MTVINERGIITDNGYSILFGLDDGVIRIYDDEEKVIEAFNENNKCLDILKNIFDDLEG